MKREYTSYAQSIRILRTVFCFAFALLFLTETFIPLVGPGEHDLMELSENQEEGEEKKEKEKEVSDTDKISSYSNSLRFLSGALDNSSFSHAHSYMESFYEIDTPPPEII